MVTIRRGTTPTIVLNIDDVEHMEEFAKWFVAIKQDSVEIVKTDEQIEIEGNSLKVRLSQEETLRYKQSEVEVQIRALTNTGVAIASDIKKFCFGRILQNGVIE